MVMANIHEVKTHLSRFIEQAEAGEVVVVCRHNKPVAEIRGTAANVGSAPRRAGLLQGQISWADGAFAPMSELELAEFEGLD